MNQKDWINAHINAYNFFGSVTKMIQCGNLKTGVKNIVEMKLT